MAEERRAYVVRDAGPASGANVDKLYPYNLRSLLEALEDARLRSYAAGPQVVVRVIGPERIIFRRFEHGQEIAINMPDADG